MLIPGILGFTRIAWWVGMDQLRFLAGTYSRVGICHYLNDKDTHHSLDTGII